MRIILLFVLICFVQPVFSCRDGLLDQNFRKLAGSEVVNLCHAYSGKVLMFVRKRG